MKIVDGPFTFEFEELRPLPAATKCSHCGATKTPYIRFRLGKLVENVEKSPILNDTFKGMVQKLHDDKLALRVRGAIIFQDEIKAEWVELVRAARLSRKELREAKAIFEATIEVEYKFS
jgi:hypothetical protein